MRTVADLVASAKATIENLHAEAVAREMETGDVLLVDLRERDELDRAGVIPGAIHAPRGMLEFYADGASPYHRPELQRSRRVVLYCASGGRSALAVTALEALGFSRVAHLDGGFSSWCAAGLPTEPWLTP